MVKKSIVTLIAEPIKVLILIGLVLLTIVELQTVYETSMSVFYGYATVFIVCIFSLIMTFYPKTRKIGYILFFASIMAYFIMALYSTEIKTAWEKQECLQTSGHWNEEWQQCVGKSAHCPPEHVWNEQKKICEMKINACRTNDDCSAGEYCYTYWFQNQNTSCENEFDADTQSPRHKGICRFAAKDRGVPNLPTGYVVSVGGMNWPSADRFCKAFGMQLVTMSDFQCRDEKLGLVGGTTDSICMDKVIVTQDVPSVAVVGFGDTFGKFTVWTADADKNECTAAQVALADGKVSRYNQLMLSGMAICKHVR